MRVRQTARYAYLSFTCLLALVHLTGSTAFCQGTRAVGKFLIGKSAGFSISPPEARPSICGRRAVWCYSAGDDQNIRGADIGATGAFPVCAAARSQCTPVISGNVVVWQDWRNGSPDIYGRNLATGAEFTVCTQADWQCSPAISGNIVVWQDWRNGNPDIYAKDLSTGYEFPVCVTPHDQNSPAISGNIVVWQDLRDAYSDIYGNIYAKDLSTGREFAVCTNPFWQGYPRISGQIVVWDDFRNEQDDIYGKNLSTGEEFAVTTAPDAQIFPAIEGDIVVWQDYRNDREDIYARNLLTGDEFAVSSEPGSHAFPAVSSNIVVWQEGEKIWGAAIPNSTMVSNVHAHQRTDGSHIVDISYDLSLPTGTRAEISIFASTDAGATYEVIPSSLTGEGAGKQVRGGMRKGVCWDCGKDVPDAKGGKFKVMVMACVSKLVDASTSDAFAVDNAAGAPASVPAYVLNPHTSSFGNLLRGQVHAHHLDYITPYHLYDRSPAWVESMYRSLGYDFIALTEHTGAASTVADPRVAGMLHVPGSVELETTDRNVLTLGAGTIGGFEGNLCSWIYGVQQSGGFAMVPFTGNGPVRAQKLLDLVREGTPPDGLAVWGQVEGPYEKTLENLWNRMIDLGWQGWGFAGDAYSPGTKAPAGRSWIAAPRSSTSGTPVWDEIRSRLAIGSFYNYCLEGSNTGWPADRTPPQVYVSTSTANGVSQVCAAFSEPMDSIEFIGKRYASFGCLKEPVSGTSAFYTVNGREEFVRVVARKSYSFGTLSISSQPIGVYKTGYKQWSEGYSGLIVRYISPLEYPQAFPPNGYIGDAFEVTGVGGTIPSRSTLRLSFDGEDVSAMGGTEHLAIYRYDPNAFAWKKLAGRVIPEDAVVEASIDSPGTYTISADLPADTTPPEVYIDSPQAGESLDTCLIKASVQDNLGAWRVLFLVNDQVLDEDCDPSDGWSAALPADTFFEDDYTLKVVAEDLAGNQGYAQVPIHVRSSAIRPLIIIASPREGIQVRGNLTLSGTCTFGFTSPAVSVKVDGQMAGYAAVTGNNWSYTFDTTAAGSGYKLVSVEIRDGRGNISAARVGLNFNNEPLAVAITSPTDQADFSTSSPSVRISGTAAGDPSRVAWSSSTGKSGECSGTVSWQSGDIALSLGKNVITVTTYGASGGTATDVLNVYRVNGTPANDSVSPQSGALPLDSTFTFTTRCSDSNGYADIACCYMVISESEQSSKAFLVLYDADKNKLYLRNDTDTKWLGGYTPGSSSTIENSYGRLYCQGTSVSGAGNTLTINWSIRLKSGGIGRNCFAWMCTEDDSAAESAWDVMGAYSYSSQPSNVSISPSSGALLNSARQTISCVYADQEGWQHLKSCCLMLNTEFSTYQSIYIKYDQDANKIYLRNDSDTRWLGGASPGSTTVIENTFCKVYCKNTRTSGSGNNLAVTWSVELKAITAGADCAAWMYVDDNSGSIDGWDEVGSFYVR